MSIDFVSPREASNITAMFLDVREFPEYGAVSIEGAVLVPLGQIPERARDWKKEEPILTICQSGRRAAEAAQQLKSLGFTNVRVLQGGMLSWRQAGLPIRTASKTLSPLDRRLRVVAGVATVLLTVLTWTVSPWFLTGILLVGVGLTCTSQADAPLRAPVLGKRRGTARPQIRERADEHWAEAAPLDTGPLVGRSGCFDGGWLRQSLAFRFRNIGSSKSTRGVAGFSVSVLEGWPMAFKRPSGPSRPAEFLGNLVSSVPGRNSRTGETLRAIWLKGLGRCGDRHG